MKRHIPAFLLIALIAAACATAPATTPQAVPAAEPAPAAVPAPTTPPGPTAADAEAFVRDAEARLIDLDVRNNRAAWVAENFITEDTQAIAAEANERLISAGVELAKGAARFNGVELPYDTRRKLDLLKNGLTLAAPSDPAKTRELTTIAAKLDAEYGSGKYCPTKDKCYDIEQLSEILATSRDPQKLLDAWKGWHTISVPMRADYARLVELANAGAQELGFKDTGAMWREKYDMPPDDFAKETDRLWSQVKPLYDSLHCYVRWKLTDKYGPTIVPPGQPIPSHLLGNLWAQEWGNIYDVVAPKNTASAGYDLTKILQAKKFDAHQMVKSGENFFISLGFEPLPDTFWKRSLFVKPKDRDVVCHASAWDVDDVNDLRIKMCIDITAEDFNTIHHELGHNFYQRAYNKLPFLYRNSANDGFHEATGDTIALSVTPKYLVKIGLLKSEPPQSSDISLLLREALDKVAFLPFGLLVDKWRWGVYSGQISPADYNKAWWDLRRQYQGVAPPLARSENDFDPGAKYHVAANVPYTRYFLAQILEYQFHRSLCQIAGQTGPLNRCTIYGNKEAGAKLNQMLSMGAGRPWQEALQVMTGSRDMDASAIVDYFAPLKTWLDQQNQGKTCGWQ